MKADIKGALKQLNRSWRAFEHNGKKMTKKQVEAALKYGLSKGYETTDQLTGSDIQQAYKNAGIN